ncbi:MAG TPA: glycerate kinase [Ornithinimicrobium sp.]|uniref:glycerate kinase n=1 Tax=Ornithinimicrobium sp. TaxID=1977084 RepID=UPI002B459625|nr:glycerate kinase [Ornithinimicrobium sp.]HKJ11418.1 glycerate kinase [Ornithinimicrobium sp.]
MPRVLIAPDKFKGSLSGAEVAAAIGRGLSRHGAARTVALPVADGGDGTVAAAVASGYLEVPVEATGPTGQPVATHYARRGDVAVVEMAAVSGLAQLPGGRLAPMTATSRGTGEILLAAVEDGCREIVLGIGGSATTDGGAGMVRALGAVFTDAHEQPLTDGGQALAGLHHLDVSAVRERMDGVCLVVACDVDNPLTGPHGAAAVYGPQKGADDLQVAELDAALGHYADLVAAQVGRDEREAPGAGAAGGVGFAGLALLGAQLRPGVDVVFDLIGFEEALEGADLVVIGEGSLDEQTLNGKAPAGVAAAAALRGVPVVAVCGRSTLSAGDLRRAGITATYALSDLEPDVERSMRDATALLEHLGEQVSEDLFASDNH